MFDRGDCTTVSPLLLHCPRWTILPQMRPDMLLALARSCKTRRSRRRANTTGDLPSYPGDLLCGPAGYRSPLVTLARSPVLSHRAYTDDDGMCTSKCGLVVDKKQWETTCMLPRKHAIRRRILTEQPGVQQGCQQPRDYLLHGDTVVNHTITTRQRAGMRSLVVNISMSWLKMPLGRLNRDVHGQ